MKNVTLCYIERGDQYLMLHRVKKKNDINHDKWIGVGGKFERDESPDDCLLREVREETEYMHLFTADGWKGSMTDCDEGVLEWVDKDKIISLPIWEGDKIFLRLLAEEHPFFSLNLSYHGDLLVSAVLDGHELAR